MADVTSNSTPPVPVANADTAVTHDVHPEEAQNGISTQDAEPVTTREPDEHEDTPNGELNENGDALSHKSGPNQEREWKSSPSMYCRRTGRQHSHLLDFGIERCPSCHETLRLEIKRRSRSSSIKSDSSSSTTSTEETDAGTGPTAEEVAEPEEAKIRHAVEYRDAGNYLITRIDWPRPFNLQKERKDAIATKYQNKDLSFTVLTVLHTSVRSDSSRLRREIEEIMEKGILENPDISVVTHSTKLLIQSQPFISALKSVISYASNTNFETGTLELNEPYALVAHHLDNLRLLKNDIDSSSVDAAAHQAAEYERSANKVTSQHLGLVLEFIEDVFKDRIKEELELYAMDSPLCTFRMLWLLLKPESTVYVKSDGKWGAYVIESVDMGAAVLSASAENLVSCLLKLWYLDFDGQYVTRCKSSAVISPFVGQKSITSLHVVPCEMWDKGDNGKLRGELENEGVKWYNLLLGQQVQYKGEFVSSRKRSFEGRAFVDPGSYHDLEGETLCEKLNDSDSEDSDDDRYTNYRRRLLGRKDALRKKDSSNVANIKQRWAQYDGIDPKTDDNLETEDTDLPPRHRYLLCSRYLKGFVFKTRTWETLDVAFCQKPKIDKTPFGRLVMPDEKVKRMIQALVFKYTDPRFAGSTAQVWGADFIKNKGEGQIFLLHGGPGVGKTFTAECIAEFTGRPLLALTCGDMGTDETELERHLGKWLKLAHKWGAVMLLDEADVFLEERMATDLKRNSLVSVFLREIEYYQGILFLTTNRVGTFDDAFISRIHVVIHYPDLNAESRRKIWKQFFYKLEEEKRDTIEIDQAAKDYVLDELERRNITWNGREIRNAFQTAVALAEYRFLTKLPKEEGEIAVLEEGDFKQVCDMTIDFKGYLKQVHNNLDEQQRAQLKKERFTAEKTMSW